MRLYLLGLLAVAACSNPTTENTPNTHPLRPDSVGAPVMPAAPNPASAASDPAANLPPAGSRR